MSEAKLCTDLKIQIALREKVFAQVQHIYENSCKLSVERVEIFRPRIDALPRLQQSFADIQEKIEKINAVLTKPEDRVEVLRVQLSFDDLLYETLGNFKALTSTVSAPTAVTSVATPAVQHNLPTIKLPAFNGELAEWPEFYSLFNTLVHNNASLDNISKFQYLRTSLKDSALAAISNLQFSSENYALAYDALVKRFENKRRLATFYLTQILEFKRSINSSNVSLQHFLNVHQNAVNALNALAIPELGDFLLLSLSLRNLDANTRKRFEDKLSSQEIPRCDDLLRFVVESHRAAELCRMDTPPALSVRKERPKMLIAQTKDSPGSKREISKLSCALCKQEHNFSRCNVFLQKPVSEQYAILRKLKRCFNCLGAHTRDNCSSTSACRKCGSTRHHTLLHTQRPPASNAVSDISPEMAGRDPDTPSVLQTSLSIPSPATTSRRTILLATLTACILDAKGKRRPVRMVLDPGSQISAISLKLAHALKLRIDPLAMRISGIDQTATRSHGTLQCTLISRFNDTHSLDINVQALKTISTNLPSSTVSSQIKQNLAHLQLADDSFDSPSPVELLLGADYFSQVILPDIRAVTKEITALSTIFGWVLIGSAPALELNSPLCLFSAQESLDTQLRRFWELEDVSHKHVPNPDDTYCEAHFASSHTRTSEGRYVVALPFKSSPIALCNNRVQVEKLYLGLEKRLRLANNADYDAFMREYLDLGHMQLAYAPASYLIPHHGVFKSSSSTTKLRVVFNASHSVRSQCSLNDLLLKGPKLQPELPDVLTGFRLHEIALCADIRMMYRQILLCPEDRKYQHILWRKDSSSSLEEYELNTVTYGLKPSAFLAQRVLKQLTLDEGALFPLAISTVNNAMYVDDVVSGASSIAEAKLLQQQLIGLLAKGGFQLRKWASNAPELLQDFPAEELETPLVLDDEMGSVKVLGLAWIASTDSFTFITRPFEGECTKRSVLSFIARIFDPLGFLAPVTFFLKHLMQRIWLSGIQWDENLPINLENDLDQFLQTFTSLAEIRIPRLVPVVQNSTRLVGFCDASERGYAAVLYVVSERSDGTTVVSLIKGKSKVAPLKPLTIPRLELTAAHLLTKLLGTIRDTFASLHSTDVVLYTDALIVIAWLRTAPHLLKSFVANRVVSILDATSLSQWRHVSSELNPADSASRGLSATSLSNNELWFHGPEFLYQKFTSWPDLSHVNFPQPTELKPSTVSLTLQVQNNFIYDYFKRYSSLSGLQRVMAYVLRFIHNTRRTRPSRGTATLSLLELRNSMKICVKVTQLCHYSSSTLASHLLRLDPFVDQEGLIRVGGRLRNAPIGYDTKHPLLLPKKAHISLLICDHYHRITLHSGPALAQALITTSYWIVSLRGLLRRSIRSCLVCHKHRRQTLAPKMGDLPPARVTLTRPFCHTGTDFAGPFMVKDSRRRRASLTKGYLCVFVCMSTKAVHLEMVTDLSTPSFLACFDRFLARRGLPQCVYSDCGRNFVGAARKLRELHDFMSEHRDELERHSAANEVQWHFNPPQAPHFGGLWEAAVKSTKRLLYRLIGDRAYTFEEYATLFARIEAVLNSRPLCGVPQDAADGCDFLTPGHFLIGAPLLAPPEDRLPESITVSERWLHLRQLHQAFWKRWSTEYIRYQTQRTRWTKDQAPIKVGDVVYLTQTPSSPLNWPVGRVVKTHPGADGTTRVVDVQTSTGVYTRAVHKLLPLPSN